MKKSLITFLASCMLAVVVVGCGSETKVESSKIKAEFSSATGEIKADADKAIVAIDSQNMQEAIRALNALLTHSNDLTQAQLDVVGQAFVAANVNVFKKGDAASAAESKAKADELKAQAKGSE